MAVGGRALCNIYFLESLPQSAQRQPRCSRKCVTPTPSLFIGGLKSSNTVAVVINPGYNLMIVNAVAISFALPLRVVELVIFSAQTQRPVKFVGGIGPSVDDIPCQVDTPRIATHRPRHVDLDVLLAVVNGCIVMTAGISPSHRHQPVVINSRGHGRYGSGRVELLVLLSIPQESVGSALRIHEVAGDFQFVVDSCSPRTPRPSRADVGELSTMMQECLRRSGRSAVRSHHVTGGVN